MKLVDPTVPAKDQSRRRAAPLPTLEGLRIGLLGNRKVNADLILSETAALFKEHHGCNVATFVEKDNASAPAPPELLRKVFEECDFMITAIGD